MAKNFAISEHKVILWSKRNILHGKLIDIREDYAGDSVLMLKESDFVINTSTDIKEKNAKKLLKKKTMRQNNDADMQDIEKSSADYIESIYCRSKTILHTNEFGHENEYE